MREKRAILFLLRGIPTLRHINTCLEMPIYNLKEENDEFQNKRPLFMRSIVRLHCSIVRPNIEVRSYYDHPCMVYLPTFGGFLFQM